MEITFCQLNPLVGDIAGNVERVRAIAEQTAGDAPDLLVFPEMFVQGYPPRDLLEHSWFIKKSVEAVEEIARISRGFPDTGILFGTAMPNAITHGRGLSNAAVLVGNGNILFQQNKSLLPTYDVFDESRYFDPARSVETVAFKGEHLGISICEDAWKHEDLWQRPLYDFDPIAALAEAGATILINISGSPFHVGKQRLRETVLEQHATTHHLPFLFVNQIGANDDLIFDGNSVFLDADGAMRAHAQAFEERVTTVDTAAPSSAAVTPTNYDTIGAVHNALVLGVRDYVRKCGFQRVLVGLSGGIDSAVTVAIAARAVGSENCHGVTMPSRYSSEGSVGHSRELADNLGIRFSTIAIEPMFDSFLQTMQPHFENKPPDITEENMQARIRGNTLMALSNKFKALLLATGNKSELAVGYCTLYGDMNGGLSVISDLPKTMVYQVAEYINREREIIPRTIIDKPPSAELRPGQKDQDTLPPYEALDRILALFIEKGRSGGEIVAEGFDRATVEWVLRAVRVNEYKRRQAATGLKVTPKAFGAGRRFPIAARYDPF